jgi:hypothetical protein
MRFLIFGILILILSLNFSVFGQKRKTLTNADLEKFKRERLRNDPDDELERQRLGLPSRSEQERKRKEDFQKLTEVSQKIRTEQAEKQNYWMSQGFQIKLEMAAVEAEINYVSAVLNRLPNPQTYYAVGYLPYFGGYYAPFGINNLTISNGQINGFFNFGSKTRVVYNWQFGQTLVRQNDTVTVTLNNPATGLSFGRTPYTPGILTVPFTLPTYENLRREELINRLQALEQTRAGLLARWQIIADQARQDGVKLD